MRKASSCAQCREAKRKCIRNESSGSCASCEQRGLKCSYSVRVRSSPPLLPSNSNSSQDTVYAQSNDVFVDLVDIYLQQIHDRPHSLFHPPTLREQTRRGLLNKALLFSICGMSCRFSSIPEIRMLEDQYAAEAKRLLLADLENICLEYVQACTLIANICAAQAKVSSEALFFGIAIDMSQIMHLARPSPTDTVVERETKMRTWWGLFMADRWCSSGLGLPRQIDNSPQSTELPMDEILFHSLDPHSHAMGVSWQPGIWAHMITLVTLFGPIQDLNRLIVQGEVSSDERGQRVDLLSTQLESWKDALPASVKLDEINLQRHKERGTGGAFVALHLGYCHYSTLLYFQFLSVEQHSTQPESRYMSLCKQHAMAFSALLRRAREEPHCEVVYPSVGQMAIVSSSVLLHTLLFGDETELPATRNSLNSNFEALIELQHYWPNLKLIINRLRSFQNMCLLSSHQHPHQLNNWMVRFLIEYSLPLEDADTEPCASLSAPDVINDTERLTEQGRFTNFPFFSTQN